MNQLLKLVRDKNQRRQEPSKQEVIDAIISKDVYDITSYLKYFNKSVNCQYDINLLRERFEQYEKGKSYLFEKGEGDHFYTITFDNYGKQCDRRCVENTSTYDFMMFPIVTPVHAVLSEVVGNEIYKFNGEKYVFDFLKQSYPVANRYEDIVNFIILWSELKREALILEVDKPITESDISVFFEKKEQDINPDANPYWYKHVEELPPDPEEDFPKLKVSWYPTKKAKDYIDRAWTINEENVLACSDYIGKKIIASSALFEYRKNKCKTGEQLYNRKNLRIAIGAALLSFFSVLFGNIFPLFQPQETDYLEAISDHLVAIEEKIQCYTDSQELLEEIQCISDNVSRISQRLDKENLEVLEKIDLQLDKINEYLSDKVTK